MAKPAKNSPGLLRNQSIQRTAQLLSALAVQPEGLSAADLARATGVHSATIGRLLATLADHGMVDRLPGDTRWILGRELVRLARAVDPYRVFTYRAQPLLVELAREAGETATASLARVPSDIEVIAQGDAATMLGAKNWLGQRFSVYASAAGKMALAHTLEPDEARTFIQQADLQRFTKKTITNPETFVSNLVRARRHGYAESVDELEDGLTGIAVVIAAQEPNTVLLLGLSGPSSRLTLRRRNELIPRLREYAAQLEGLLGE